jgi:di/tricarboxylate transporter
VFVAANQLRMDLAALLMAILLGGLQFFGLSMLGPANSPTDAILSISGFSQTVVITLIALFVITRGLEKSGITHWMARQILALGGKSESRLIALFTALTAFLSLFMNNLAAGALVLPSAMEASRRTGIRPSKLLIPVAYGSLLGGAATYFTSANIIMSDLLRIAHPPQAPLNILDFTPTGGLIALAGILLFGLMGKRLLPDRQPAAEQAVARQTGSELEDIYQISERLWEAHIREDSPVIDKTLGMSELGRNWGITVAAIQRGHENFVLPSSDQKIHRDDVLFLLLGGKKRSPD